MKEFVKVVKIIYESTEPNRALSVLLSCTQAIYSAVQRSHTSLIIMSNKHDTETQEPSEVIHFFFFRSITEPCTDVTRYSSEEISGNEANVMTERDRQVELNRRREEMKRKRRRKKRTSSSMQSSCFQGKTNIFPFYFLIHYVTSNWAWS